MPNTYGKLIRDGVNYSHDTADSISYNNNTSGLTSTNTQDAIDEIKADMHDENVTQTNTDSSDANYYRVLFSGTSDNTTRTEGARKSSEITIQPSTGRLRSKRLNVENNEAYSVTPFGISVTGRTASTTAGQTINVMSVAWKTHHTADPSVSGDTDVDVTRTAYPIAVIGNNTSDANNNGVILGSNNGTTIVGAGESSRTYAAAQSHFNDESLYLTADGSVVAEVGLSNDSTTSQAKLLFNNTFLQLRNTNGVAGTAKAYDLIIGNEVDKSVAGNSYGRIRIFDQGTKQVYLITDTLSANRTIKLPDNDGTVALTSDCITIGTASNQAAAGNHTHTTTIAADSGTSSLNMAANTVYKITAGGTEFIFKTPADGNTDTKVTVTKTNPSSGTWYYPVWYTAESGTGGVNANNGFRYYTLEGTSAAAGRTIMSLGNATQTGTAGNKYGEIRLYSQKQGYATITMTSGSTAERAITIPDKAGTMALTSDIPGAATTAAAGLMSAADKIKLNGIATSAEVNQNAFSNIKVGSTTVAADAKTDTVEYAASGILTITGDATNDKVTFGVSTGTTSATAAAGNHTHGLTLAADTGTSTVSLAANSKYKLTAGGSSVIFTTPPDNNTDTKVTVTETNPSSLTTYYPTWYTAVSGTGGVNANDGFKYAVKEGTSAAVGRACAYLGNATVTGTAGNKRGELYIYSQNQGYARILATAATSAEQVIYMPNDNGTIALTKNIPGNATTAAAGLMSAADKIKLNDIATGAEVNQNAFSNIVVGSTTVAADTETDSVTFVGDGITITPDATNDKITFTGLTLGTSSNQAAKGNHTHTLTLAADTGTSTVSLAANSKYKLTAGGSSVIFTTPPDSDTWTALVGATSSANGSVGYINAAPPSSGYNYKFFQANGTWSVPSIVYTTTSTANSDLPICILSVSGSNGALRYGANGPSFNPSTKLLKLDTTSARGAYMACDRQFFVFAASNEADYRVALGVLDSTWAWVPETHGKLALGTSNHRWTVVYANDGAINTSDRNLKKDIVDLDSKAKDFIMDLKPVSYKLKDGTSNRTHYGLIAQDVEDTMSKHNMTALDFAGFCKDQKYEDYRVPKLDEEGKEILNKDGTVFTELRQRKLDGEYIYGLRYEEFIAPLIKTVQLQQEEINSCKATISTLTDKVDRLEKLVEQLLNK